MSLELNPSSSRARTGRGRKRREKRERVPEFCFLFSRNNFCLMGKEKKMSCRITDQLCLQLLGVVGSSGLWYFTTYFHSLEIFTMLREVPLNCKLCGK